MLRAALTAFAGNCGTLVCDENFSKISRMSSANGHTCGEYKEWFEEQCGKRHIPITAIVSAEMTIVVQVSNIAVRTAFGYTHRSADFAFACQSRISTDEKVYEGKAVGEK